MHIRPTAAAAFCFAAAAIAAEAASAAPQTATPIRHLVVIFQENVSFDHYFATYPVALNPAGEPGFTASPATPAVNGLGTLVNGVPQGTLLTLNPNALNPANGANAINPFRLDRSQAATCDQDHDYSAEQRAFDGGLMDLFPAAVGAGGGDACAWGRGDGLVMGYFDGNTVTALWNYAQHYALNDNFFGSTFGPSTLGALNLVAGNTYPATPSAGTGAVVATTDGVGTLIDDLDPTGDVCSGGVTVQLGGPNIGDLLNARGITWGAFMGGFDLTAVNPDGSTGCGRTSSAHGGQVDDYIPHHAFFQYFASTANPRHVRPASPAAIGTADDGGANHQYDIADFFAALAAGNLTAVSFLKAPGYEDGHAGYSDPLLEQQFLVGTINAIMATPQWRRTAIVILYDDSDGWYDHQIGPTANPSAVAGVDQLNGPGACGNGTPLANAAGVPIEGRCGYGPRLPLLLISPFAKPNFVDHTLTDQSSVIRFVEDNWHLGRLGGGSFDASAGTLRGMLDFGHSRAGIQPLLLDPSTGEPQ